MWNAKNSVLNRWFLINIFFIFSWWENWFYLKNPFQDFKRYCCLEFLWILSKAKLKRTYSFRIQSWEITDNCVPSISYLLHFVAFLHVASLFSTGVDNKKLGVDNEKALELDNRIIFSYLSLILMKKYHAKMQQNILLHSGMITPNILV